MNSPITVKDALELQPIVEKAVRILYGKAMQNIKILKMDQFPFFRQPKEGWLVQAEFNDGKYEYSIQMDVQMADCRITRSAEMHRTLLKK